MKIKNLTIQTLFISLCCLAALGCAKEKDELAHHHHGPEGEGGMHEEIVLSPAMAERFGVTADTVSAGEFYEVVETAGKVETSASGTSIVAAPVAGTVHFVRGISQGSKVGAGATVATVSPSKVAGGDPNKAARAAVDAASREVERLRPLHESGIVSTRDWNAALAALDQAKAAYSAGAASGRATSSISGTVTALNAAEGSYVNAGDPIATVSSQQDLVLRADVPERYFNLISSLKSAKVKLPYTDSAIDLADLGGKRITAPAGAVATAPGYVPVYFSFRNDGTVLSGGFARVYLQGSPREGVITLPMEAISEQQGNFYVYQRLDEECYRKLAVTTGARDGELVEITSGVTTGMAVVTSGTAAVRLAETSTVAPEGHSHNH